MPDPSGPSATLEAIKERLVASRTDETGAVIRSQRDVAPLVAALEAVLKAHRPSTTDGRCCWCRDADGQRSAWPCGEYLTITRALKGE